jgi:type IV pilus assembly protein PilY1
MKPNPSTAVRFRTMLAAAALALAVAVPANAAVTDIATIPMANATAQVVLPNIWFILDDSGSMAWKTIPGATSELQFIPRLTDFWSSAHCNGLGYDPTQTYARPPSQGTTTFSDALVTGACGDGYGGSCGSGVDLTSSLYFTYSSPGTQSDLAFTYTGAAVDTTTTFYKECNTASANITISNGSKSCYATSVMLGTTQLLPASTAASTDPTVVASRIAAGITTAGYAAMVDPANNRRVLVYSSSASDAGKNPTATVVCTGGGTTMTAASTAFPAAASAPGMGKFTPVKVSGLTAAQKTNYANWYSYYRTRINMMKTVAGLAFQDVRGKPKTYSQDPVDGDYIHARVGFTSLHDNSGLGDLTLGAFENTVTPVSNQKKNFYNILYGASANSGTPLRTKLKEAGDMYMTTGTTAPIWYSCQRNYTLLTTDGYWNDSFSAIGNRDGSGTARPQYDGGGGTTSDTLADVAMYYYKTDLRTGGVMDGQLPEPDADADTAIDDVARYQHMVTFGVSLGADGTLKYNTDYKTSADTSTDFWKIRNTAANWPVPVGDTPTAVDDLWHAAVNGRGTYFNTKNPRALAAGLKQALGAMGKTSGSGSANATGSLNPSVGDKAYTAAYKTSDWTGDVVANTLNSDGSVSSTVVWSASTALKTRIAADGKSDSRTIFTGKTSLASFVPANIAAGDQAYFNNNQLNQYIDDWTAAQKTAGTWDKLVNYVRGQSQYEVKTGATAQLYRARKGVLGDIVHSQPVYVGAPSFNFQDAGYTGFKTGNASRAGTVYVGANDGMLHAFDSGDGSERWAYVPPMVYPNLWRLADRDYSMTHRYYVDGPMAISDAQIGGQWRTVLIGGLGGGGRGYYALDITTPATPTLLWTFSADDNPNVGYTFGTPLIAKVEGRWVAVLASGYNNVPEGSKYAGATGRGYVFVRDLADGSEVRTIGTGVGSTTTPSGLATVNLEVKSAADYTARKAYGGDLEGNMWRFDLSAGSASKLISLGNLKPITSAPEIARPSGPSSAPVVYFGTGRYLGKSDLENTDPQSFYAVKDDGSTTVAESQLGTPYSVSGGTLSGGSPTAWGWYVNLNNSGERVNIHPQIQLGVVLFVTTVPPSPPPAQPANPTLVTAAMDAAACAPPGGTGWLYQLSYKNGGPVDESAQVGLSLVNAPVGLVLIGTKNLPGFTDPTSADGKFTVNTGAGKSVSGDIKKPRMPGSMGNATRLQWRELLK